jgi:hypothetical protein
MTGFTFSTPVRVRFADTDAQGIAHNASYPVWFEVARVEYLREHAGGYQALRDHGIEALVLESYCRYRVPVRFDDVLNVHTRVWREGCALPLRVPDRPRRRNGGGRGLDEPRLRGVREPEAHPRTGVAARRYCVG